MGELDESVEFLVDFVVSDGLFDWLGLRSFLFSVAAEEPHELFVVVDCCVMQSRSTFLVDICHTCSRNQQHFRDVHAVVEARVM